MEFVSLITLDLNLVIMLGAVALIGFWIGRIHRVWIDSVK